MQLSFLLHPTFPTTIGMEKILVTEKILANFLSLPTTRPTTVMMILFYPKSLIRRKSIGKRIKRIKRIKRRRSEAIEKKGIAT